MHPRSGRLRPSRPPGLPRLSPTPPPFVGKEMDYIAAVAIKPEPATLLRPRLARRGCLACRRSRADLHFLWVPLPRSLVAWQHMASLPAEVETIRGPQEQDRLTILSWRHFHSPSHNAFGHRRWAVSFFLFVATDNTYYDNGRRSIPGRQARNLLLRLILTCSTFCKSTAI